MPETRPREREGVAIFDIKQLDRDVLLAVMAAAEAGTKHVVLNLEGLVNIYPDSEGLLLRCVAVVSESGGTLKVVEPRPRLRGLLRRLPEEWVSKSEDEAVAAILANPPSEPEPAGPTVTEKGGVELVPIPPGSFLMGAPETEAGRFVQERPQHEVTLTAFEIGKYLVTNEQYGRFLEANPDTSEPKYSSNKNFNQTHQPVVGVSWNEAKAFAEWVGCRLPTEAEWEYAARAGTTEPYLAGRTEEVLGRFAWYSGNSEGKLQPVGKKEPNAWGLYDVLGNASECVEDDWHYYDQAPVNGDAWVDEPRGISRVVRAASFDALPKHQHVTYRSGMSPSGLDHRLGFRVARSSSGGQE